MLHREKMAESEPGTQFSYEALHITLGWVESTLIELLNWSGATELDPSTHLPELMSAEHHKIQAIPGLKPTSTQGNSLTSFCWLEGVVCCVLWNAVHMVEAREGDVQRDGLRPLGLGVRVVQELLLPAAIALLRGRLLQDRTRGHHDEIRGQRLEGLHKASLLDAARVTCGSH
jgi:hypothetical protein